GTISYRYGHTVARYDMFKKRVLDDIKNDPYGRYHICNLWQEEEFKNRPDGLKPCAYETIWTVTGNKLNMFLNQRSGDLLAASGAGGINEVQYAALLMMVARDTGYEPGIFTHFVANEQIYDRHVNQAIELLNRAELLETKSSETDTMPQLVLNPDKKNFYDMCIDDFSIQDYEPMSPQIALELGI
ncbi:MAG TPA: thymidylate synthase, partial [Lachnospiraceae bacterium]|nr:thymidylate synthase [Lachnospiraceae bacterium]